jgi:hypothetical protein
MGSTKTKRTGACKRINIICTGSSILTRVGGTVIFVCLTVLASKSRYTEASVVSSAIKTSAAIQARRFGTVISVDNTVSAFKSFCAQTLVASFCVHTTGAISAWGGSLTFINIFITIPASESNLTGAGKVSVGSIGAAYGAIGTWI